jgi:bacillopeptidase F
MKERYLVSLAFVALLHGGTITPELQAILEQASITDRIPIIVQTSQQGDLAHFAAAGYDDKILYLKDVAEQAQSDLLRYLPAVGATDVKSFWLVSRIALKALPEVIRALARRDDVAFVMDDYVVKIEEGSCPEPLADALDTPEWHITKIAADSCWLAGYDGQGIVVGNIDTGVEVTHPAFGGRWRSTNGWFDAVNGDSIPYDDNGHGTHTMGTLAGGDGLGPSPDDIGVAPGCSIVCAKAFDAGGGGQAAAIQACFDWIAGTARPNVCSNSWGLGARTDTTWAPCVRNLKNLNIIVTFTIGSYGPGDSTSNPPGSFPMCLGNGATTNTDDLASFTARGPAPNLPPWNVPSEWPRPDWSRINPSLVAPGVNVRSSHPGGGYEIYSGTSMGTPQVAGAAALLLQKRPSLAYPEIFTYLTDKADHPPQGGSYPNNGYGWGRLNCKRALDAVPPAAVEESPEGRMPAVRCAPNPFRNSLLVAFELREPTDVRVTIRDVSGRVVARIAPGLSRAGTHTVTWHSPGVPAGVYFVSIRTRSACRHYPVTKL